MSRDMQHATCHVQVVCSMRRARHRLLDIASAAELVKDSMASEHGLVTLPATFNALPDGEIVPWEPHGPLGARPVSTIPLMVGSNANEMSDFARFIGVSMGGRLGRWLAGLAVGYRWLLAPEPFMRLAAGRKTRADLSDTDARATCDALIVEMGGSIEALIDVLATQPERELARSLGVAGSRVYEFEVRPSRPSLPRMPRPVIDWLRWLGRCTSHARRALSSARATEPTWRSCSSRKAPVGTGRRSRQRRRQARVGPFLVVTSSARASSVCPTAFEQRWYASQRTGRPETSTA
jgi:hypothetical protein